MSLTTSIYTRFKSYFIEGSQRSIKIKKNILAMLFIRGGSILIGLLIVRLTFHYVNSVTYGIWIALSSMVAWISFFDIGINNGLKNRLTESLANEDYELSRKYVSTTYALLACIFIPMMVILLIVSPYFNWESVLNIPRNSVSGLLASISVIITYFCINFVLSTVNVVLLADQRPADASLRSFVQQLIVLVLIYVLSLTTDGNLLNLCLVLCGAPVIVALLFNITLFSGRYKKISPKWSAIDFKVSPSLLKLGSQFFFIQIAGVVQYQMINIIIIRYYGASEVTAYNISYKYFNVLYMVWSILTTPIWAATTDAVTKNDYRWIKEIISKYLKTFVGFALGALSLLIISSPMYHLWIGDSVVISFSLSLWIMIYNVVMMFGSVFVQVINGTGQLKIQTYACIISPLVFLACAYLLIKGGVGVYSVLIAAIISNFNGLILAPIQCKGILKSFENCSTISPSYQRKEKKGVSTKARML